ncbi:MAG: nucleoside triphosphate pyrophosphatase [Acidobacteriota bacterium]
MTRSSASPPRLILASRSPRRRFLLRLLDVPFSVIPPGVPEDPLPRETPRQRSRRLALSKASAVARRRPRAYVLGSDTIVCQGNKQLGIPKNRPEAEAMLRLLAGSRHTVWTGVALARPHYRTRTVVVCTRVHVARLSRAELTAFLDSGEWRGKAGGYGIQGRFAAYIVHLEGTYTNVMGLPLDPVRRLLRAAGFAVPAHARQAVGGRQRKRGRRAAATSSRRRTGVR